jgi:hypothetical protein
LTDVEDVCSGQKVWNCLQVASLRIRGSTKTVNPPPTKFDSGYVPLGILTFTMELPVIGS